VIDRHPTRRLFELIAERGDPETAQAVAELCRRGDALIGSSDLCLLLEAARDVTLIRLDLPSHRLRELQDSITRVEQGLETHDGERPA
jgi:hypothetical protein